MLPRTMQHVEKISGNLLWEVKPGLKEKRFPGSTKRSMAVGYTSIDGQDEIF